MTHEPILVWEYCSAPKELQISQNGGDEDWLAEIPPEFVEAYIGWLESDSFGCCDITEFDHPTKIGWIIKIGSHA